MSRPKGHPDFIGMRKGKYAYRCNDRGSDCDGEVGLFALPLPYVPHEPLGNSKSRFWCCGGCRGNY